MKKKRKFIKQILYTKLFCLLMMTHFVKTYAQSIPASNPDHVVAPATNVRHTNNDITSAGHVVVWDENGTSAFLSFGTGAIPLNNGGPAYDPDVSTLTDPLFAWNYTIAVYQDPVSQTINADVFSSGVFVTTQILWQFGGRPKIDADGGGKAVVVWEDISTVPYRSIMSLEIEGRSGGPTFYAPVLVEMGPGTGIDYSDPDVAFEAYSYLGTTVTSIIYFANTPWGSDVIYNPSTCPHNSSIGSGFSSARITAGPALDDDIAIVAEKSGDIYGFLFTSVNAGAPPPNPIFYGTGTLPVCAYVWDVFNVLWERGNTIVARISARDGSHMSPLLEVSDQAGPGGIQSVPTVSGYYYHPPNLPGGSFDLYSSFYDNGLLSQQISDKISHPVVPAGAGIFRTTTNNGQKPSCAVYPTPFTDEVTFKLPLDSENASEFLVTITDALGSTVYEVRTLGHEQIVWKPGKDVTTGIYYLKIINCKTTVTSLFKLLKL